MCNFILFRTFFLIFTCLVCCGLAATTIHREGPNLLSSQQSNLSQSRVSISVKVVKNGQHIKLKTSQDLKLLEDILKVTHSDITIYVHQPSWNHSVVWNLKSSPLLISKDLKVVYFNSSATQRNHINSRKLTCFYSGFEGVGHLLSQVELCNGVFDADLYYLNNLYKIMTSEGEKGEINFVMLQKHIPQILGKCGNKVDLGLHRVPRSVKKEAHAPALNNFSTRYIEMYLVADHKLFLRSGSNRNQTVSRLLKIVNYASSLFQKLNIYLALVGIEVWENGDKIDVTGNINQVLRDFEYYRRTVISANTPNDNAQLIVAESFDENLIGQASSSICSHAGGAGVSADHYVDNWVMAATTLAHELGHNLGLDHDDELPNSAECTCPQVDGVNHCIMHSGSSSM
ncbi:ADAM8 [Bugula neritina]|uniref:ADAM8 n=1 Tax=Bugula neritina TaxID=10212 RepID=A0A7J7J1K5_BUGNE|nr:ADAM8 [Bugula neritina]